MTAESPPRAKKRKSGSAAEAPPVKKRKRAFDSYDDFLNIITKLGNDYESALFSCFDYDDEYGITCTVSSMDPKLKGPFSSKSQ